MFFSFSETIRIKKQSSSHNNKNYHQQLQATRRKANHQPSIEFGDSVIIAVVIIIVIVIVIDIVVDELSFEVGCILNESIAVPYVL